MSQLNCFLVSAKYMSFTKAAKVLFLTQSVVSRQIQALEEELNVTLFVRERKRIFLTPAGAVMFERLPHIYCGLESLICDIQAIESGSAGMLHIGMMEGHYMSVLLNPAIRWFTDRKSKLQLSVKPYSIKELIPALYRSELDIIVTALSDVVTLPDLETMELGTDKMYLCCRNNHPALENEKPKFIDFKDDIFLSFPDDISRQMTTIIIRAGKQANFTPQLKLLSGMGEMFIWLEMGLGVAFVSGNCMIVNNPKLAFIELNDIPNPILAIAWHKDNTNHLVRAFVAELEASNSETGKT